MAKKSFAYLNACYWMEA